MSTARLHHGRAAVEHTVRMQRAALPAHLALVPPAPPTPTPAAKACLNCEQPLDGKFCAHCGQAARAKRFVFGDFLLEIPHAALHFDHALPHTLRALLTTPAKTIRAYLAGKRAHVYSPVSLLFTLAGLLVLARAFTVLPEAVDLTLSSDPLVIRSHHIDVAALTRSIITTMRSYGAWTTLLLIPVNALAPYVVLRRRTGYTFGEQMVAETMLASGVGLLRLAFVPALWALMRHPRVHGAVTTVSNLLPIAYTLWVWAGLQDDGTARDRGARWGRAALALLGTAFVNMVVYTYIAVYLAVVVALYYWLAP